MPATPATLNHLRNSTIATFFFFLLLIATLSTAIAISPETVTLPNDPDGSKKMQVRIIVQVSTAVAGTVLAVCTLTTFGLGMQIPPLRK